MSRSDHDCLPGVHAVPHPAQRPRRLPVESFPILVCYSIGLMRGSAPMSNGAGKGCSLGSRTRDRPEVAVHRRVPGRDGGARADAVPVLPRFNTDECEVPMRSKWMISAHLLEDRE